MEMKAGETLVAEAIAARAGSRLDALVTIFSPDGRELAADDDLFGRDAAAWATAPGPGRYLVQIQDANGRHRDGGDRAEDDPAIPPRNRPAPPGRLRLPGRGPSGPSGRRSGSSARTCPTGRPASSRRPTRPLGDFAFAPVRAPTRSNLRVGDVAEVAEAEPDDEADQAQAVTVPAAINGTFAAPAEADVDVFRLKAGRAGRGITPSRPTPRGSARPPTRSWPSSTTRGSPQAEDDDKLGRDARIERRIDSRDGLLVSVRDYYGRGGDRFVYRIEVEPVARGVAIVGRPRAPDAPPVGVAGGPGRGRAEGVRRPGDGPGRGNCPTGCSPGPVTIAAGESRGSWSSRPGPTPPLGAFPPRLAARDAPARPRSASASGGRSTRSRARRTRPKGPRETTVDAAEPVLAVADRPRSAWPRPSGPVAVAGRRPAELRFAVDRRPGAAKKPIKVRLVAPGKALEGFEPSRSSTSRPTPTPRPSSSSPGPTPRPGRSPWPPTPGPRGRPTSWASTRPRSSWSCRTGRPLSARVQEPSRASSSSRIEAARSAPRGPGGSRPARRGGLRIRPNASTTLTRFTSSETRSMGSPAPISPSSRMAK